MGKEDAGVTVPRWVVVAGAVLLVGSLLTIAFLAGFQSRESRPSTPPGNAREALPKGAPRQVSIVGDAASPARPESSRGVAARHATAAPIAAPQASRGVAARQATPSPLEAPAPAPAAVASPALAPRPMTVDPAMRKKVSAYFAATDRSLAVARHWDSVDSVTQAAVLQATRCDPRKLEAILQANRQAFEDVQALDPPEPCRLHHQLALQILRNATRLVENVASSTITGNLEGLGDDLAPAAEAVRNETARMRAVRLEVCRRYGVPVPRDGGN